MTAGLRILITNNTLGNRAGTELYVRDVATSLLARGHTPIAYSATLGEVAQELRAATIPVIDDLDSMAIPPDIIHGQHHLETMTALLRFPGVPAVYFCHGWLPWEEAPPRFPRILRYVAVDNTCRDRLVYEHAIPEDQIQVLFNFVDLERFKARAPLPKQPSRALVFSNNASELNYVRLIRAACKRADIELDVVGLGAGNITAHPESMLGEYDLIFAKGRAALESLAVGAAVVLCDSNGIGPLVTAAEFDRLRSLNFGIRALGGEISEAVIEQRISQYDPEDAAEVSSRVRAVAGREQAVDRIETIYRDVLREFQSTARGGLVEEERAASDYLRRLSPLLKHQTAAAASWLESRLEITRQSQTSVEIKTPEEPEENPAPGKEFDPSSLEEDEKETAECQTDFQDSRDDTAEAISETVSDIDDGRLRAAQNELSALQARLAISEALIDRMTGSFGWRVISLYGPIKYRVVLPVYNRIKNVFSREGQPE